MTQSANLKVFIVTEGSYSSYRIERVYLTRADAERYIAENEAINGYSEFNDVEEWDIGSGGAEYDGPAWRADWTFTPIFNDNHMPDLRDPANRKEQFHEPRQFWLTGDGAQARLTHRGVSANYRRTVRVEGTSREHVEKAVRDAAAQEKAQALGIA